MQVLKHHICAIAPGVRLQFEKAQDAWVLLYPEGMVTLGDTAADILRAVDGQRDVEAVVLELQRQYGESDELADDVLEFMSSMVEQGWVKAHD